MAQRALPAGIAIVTGAAGGMGAPEAVPFSSRQSAEAFRLIEGGRVLELAEISNDMVLAPVETRADEESGDDDNFDGRLGVLPNKAGG